MNSAYIVDAVRTPRSKGKSGGRLSQVKPVTLGASVLNALKNRNQLNTKSVDDVIFGCATPVNEQGGNIAKNSVQAAGWDIGVPGFQLDRACGSGLEAVTLAAQKVISGWQDVVVAGGVESLSRVKMGSMGSPALSDPEFILSQKPISQGVAADLLAALDGFTREDVDKFALESQKRAAAAQKSGHFDRSVIEIKDRNGLLLVDRDDFIKPDTTLESLGQLKPSFSLMGEMGMDDVALSQYNTLSHIPHIHTAGNSSGIVDGASALLIAGESALKEFSLTPRCRIVASATVSTDPQLMLAGPGPAAQKCLKKAGLKACEIDVWEINEAFASVVLRFIKEMEIDPEIVNVNGGAIALGHPLGATGGMLVGTVVDELERAGANRGLITLCTAGGMGVAMIIERV